MHISLWDRNKTFHPPPQKKLPAAQQKNSGGINLELLVPVKTGAAQDMYKVSALLCRSTAPGAQERMKLKVVFKGGKFIQDFAAGRITTPYFHVCSGWCFHSCHLPCWHLSSEMDSHSLWYSVSRKHLLTLLFAPLSSLCLCFPLTISLLPLDHIISSW